MNLYYVTLYYIGNLIKITIVYNTQTNNDFIHKRIPVNYSYCCSL